MTGSIRRASAALFHSITVIAAGIVLFKFTLVKAPSQWTECSRVEQQQTHLEFIAGVYS